MASLFIDNESQMHLGFGGGLFFFTDNESQVHVGFEGGASLFTDNETGMRGRLLLGCD